MRKRLVAGSERTAHNTNSITLIQLALQEINQMKIKIEYWYDQFNTGYTHWAKALLWTRRYVGCGTSYEAAKISLMKDINEAIERIKAGNLEPPPPEEVEVDIELEVPSANPR